MTLNEFYQSPEYKGTFEYSLTRLRRAFIALFNTILKELKIK